MTVTAAACKRAIDFLRGAGVTGLASASPDVWASVLNAAPATVVDGRGRRTPVTRPDGTTGMLRPEDHEVMPAATRIASVGSRFVQAADLAAAIQDRRHGSRQARIARIRADADAHGTLIPDGLGHDVAAELAWRRAATAAVGAGAPRAVAEAHAWEVIGRTPPATVTAADRSRDVRRLITVRPPEPGHDPRGGRPLPHAPQRRSEGPGAAQRGQAGTRDRSKNSVPDSHALTQPEKETAMTATDLTMTVTGSGA